MHSNFLYTHQPLSAPVADFGGHGLNPSTSAGGSGVIPPSSQRDADIKQAFVTREGIYRQMTLAEYSRPNRLPLAAGATPTCNAPVRVSFLNMEGNASCPLRGDTGDFSPSSTSPKPALLNGTLATEEEREAETIYDRICFNVGREIYVYVYKGVSGAADLNRPIDKRTYKGTHPTCHHFNQETATPTSCSLIIGFSAGQMQLLDPFQKDYHQSRLYNEERLVERTPASCIRWVPGQPLHFLVAHTSGSLYLYHEEVACVQTPPGWTLLKQGDKYAVFSNKSKSPRNPVQRWTIGHGAIHQFAFSPADPNILAVVGHDGYLRIFNYAQQELLSYMKSYFGGLLCLSWSPDGFLVATGGEDDLLTIYSSRDKRVICRGVGHKSWISQVAFDPFWNGTDDFGASATFGSEEDIPKASEMYGRSMASSMTGFPQSARFRASATAKTTGPNGVGSHMTYRVGSVGHDTMLCFWDITDEVLKYDYSLISSQRHRNSTIHQPFSELNVSPPAGSTAATSSANSSGPSSNSGTLGKDKKKKLLSKKSFAFAAKLTGGGNHDRRPLITPDGDSNSSTLSGQGGLDDSKLLGTKLCPRMNELPLIEPSIAKKISHERLTTLEFRRDCFVTACQEGFICTWARPGKGPTTLSGRNGEILEENVSISGASPGDGAPTATFMPPTGGVAYWNRD